MPDPDFPQPPLSPTLYPVVLMHGFGAMAGFLPGGGLLHAEAMHLRAHGVHAYAPRVNPYEGVAVRAGQWVLRLERVFEETGAGRVSLVGFSLGGLDARHLAAGPLRERIATIVTVSTPHRGTPLATYLLEGPERLAALSVQAMEFFGRKAWKADPPNVAAALRELTPAHVDDVFNPAHPPPEGVWCASYSARAGAGVYPPLRVSQRLLAQLAGDNDGLVPTASAIWGEHLGTVEADHARLGGVGTAPGFDSKAFYLDVARVLRERGF